MRNQVGQVWKQQVGYFNALLEENSLGQSPDLLKAIQHQVMSGGKRLRASIPSFILQYLGQVTGRSLLGQEEDSAKWLGLCAELLHSATLCHDDLMDGDRTRRNSPTVWVTYGAPQAINAGDLLFYVGEEAIHRSPLSAEMKLLALKYVARCMSIVIHGQALEIELRRDKILPDLKSYESVVVGKTGGLFSLCLVFGGIAVFGICRRIETRLGCGRSVPPDGRAAIGLGPSHRYGLMGGNPLPGDSRFALGGGHHNS